MIDKPDYSEHDKVAERAEAISRARWEGRMEVEVKAMKEGIQHLTKSVDKLSTDMNEMKAQLTHNTGVSRGRVAVWSLLGTVGLICATLLAGVLEHWLFHA